MAQNDDTLPTLKDKALLIGIDPGSKDKTDFTYAETATEVKQSAEIFKQDLGRVMGEAIELEQERLTAKYNEPIIASGMFFTFGTAYPVGKKGEAEVFAQKKKKELIAKTSEAVNEAFGDDYSSMDSYNSYSMTGEAYARYKQLEALADMVRDMGFDSVEDAKRFLESRKGREERKAFNERVDKKIGKAKEAAKDRQILV